MRRTQQAGKMDTYKFQVMLQVACRYKVAFSKNTDTTQRQIHSKSSSLSKSEITTNHAFTGDSSDVWGVALTVAHKATQICIFILNIQICI